MGVKIRYRKLRDGSEQIFFDVYHKGRREYPTFKEPQLILRPGTDEATKKANAVMEAQAHILLKRLELQLLEGTYEWQQQSAVESRGSEAPQSFLAYFRDEAERRKTQRGCKSNTYACFKHFERFVNANYGSDVAFAQFTSQLVEKFKCYLEQLVAYNKDWNSKRIHGKRGINNNCALIYLKRLKMVSAMAHKAGIITSDPASTVKNFNYVAPERHYLLPDEVKALVKDWEANQSDDLMKRAFLFCCATGLRWADLTSLTWKDVQGNKLDTSIAKSGGKKRLSFELSDFAVRMMGEIGASTYRIFPLQYSLYLNTKLERWVLSNGINKKISWHCGRHTFATALLFQSEDISLVQKALAHSRLETTQIYAKILDTKLNKATSSIGNLFE
ncbi:site-specific integrase [Solirubrum puertoriconensis]|uniref:Tyr recombinase domain-containing protein n=1 Tax=Solirubrum puertoriconensis TaxID=1751427 RepID=A0A9X0L3C0_SOLP1|nr:site-specific integrase [Solirubrum puertoriconensis]KUG06353.1 hypothetical protein ASU33_03075 [Solirubrum puertoriconensis]